MAPLIRLISGQFSQLSLVLGLLTAGCSGTSSTHGAGAGGDRPGGGTSADVATGGNSAASGSEATSGATATNRAETTGRVSATGGQTATGGVPANGGHSATGGTTSSGGKSTTTAAAGGTTESGGNAGAGGRSTTTAAAGGTTEFGGNAGAGGTSSTGGHSAIAGGSATGGMPTTGGTSSTGGSTSTGGNAGTPNVTIDVSQEFQTIEGFGFFGAQDSWWGNAKDLWSDAWGTQVIQDLGITIWRNEYYSEESDQDANWAKQLPVVQGFKKIADANRVPLKFIYTVWSPPSSMKCTVGSVQAGQTPCTNHPDGTKNGGTLDPSKYEAYGQWLMQGIKNYADAGVDLYALSPQNEPMFVEGYNSCVYDVDAQERNSYARFIKAVAPVVKQAYPNVKIFGTENMLELEGQEWFYSANFDSATFGNFDVLAYHGYQDGVAPTASSQLATYWTYVRTNWGAAHGKASWMTETSGYTDDWSGNSGARALGHAIYSALSYGQVSAWVWWQGSELGGAPGQYTLMGGTQYLGKRYYVSKNFYRFIRPGAKMVKVSSSDSNLFAVAFTHSQMGSFTLVVINTAAQDKNLVLDGANLPSTFTAYRTSVSDNCATIGSVSNGSIVLKADSVTTLVNGNVYE